MRKGFLAVVLLVSFLPLFFQSIQIYAAVQAALGEMKNELISYQKAADLSYEIEDGFFLTVRKSLQEEKNVCNEIRTWARGYDFEFYVGFVDASSYAPGLLYDAFNQINDPCENFLFIENGRAQIKDRGLIDRAISVAGYEKAFVFIDRTHDVEVTVLIPEGTVIEK